MHKLKKSSKGSKLPSEYKRKFPDPILFLPPNFRLSASYFVTIN